MIELRAFRRSGWLASGLVVVGLLASATAASAGAEPATNPNIAYEFTASVPVTGTAKPYTLSLDAFGQDGTANLTIELKRRAPTGNRPVQEHTWFVNNATFHCHANLSTCTLKTGSHMGAFGSLDLTFAPSAAAHTHAVDCDFAPHQLLDTATARGGQMTGSLDLATGTGYFGTIHNGSGSVQVPAAITGKAQKEVFTDNMCFGPETCVKEYQLTSNDNVMEAVRPAGSGLGTVTFDVQDPASGGDVTLDHEITGSAPDSFMTIVQSQLRKITLDFGAFAPFLSGTAMYTKTVPLDPGSGSCPTDLRVGNITGNLAGHFDGWGRIDLALPQTGIAFHTH